MSLQLGLELLQPNCRLDRIPVMEHFFGCSREVVTHFTGFDPLASGAPGISEIYRKLAEKLEMDFIWGGYLQTITKPMIGATAKP